MNFYTCPRCGSKALEHLKTYSHCFECLYVQDRWVSPYSIISDAFGSNKKPTKASVIDLGKKHATVDTKKEVEEAS